MSSHSENEDDPGTSGEEWQGEEKKRVKRKAATRAMKKAKLEVYSDESSEEEEDEDEEDAKKKPRGGRGRPKKKEVDSSDNSRDGGETDKEFPSGSFVILKSDAEAYDLSNPSFIWRIDGKALLQKFEPFQDNGKLKYRNTSVYTGWSPLATDRYSPIKNINILINTQHKFVLSFEHAQLQNLMDGETEPPITE